MLGCQAACAFVSSMATLLMVSLCMAQAWQMQLLVTSCPGLNLFTVTTPTSPVRRSWVIEWTKQELDLGPWCIQPAWSLICVNYLQLWCFCCKSQPGGFQKASTRGSIRSIPRSWEPCCLPFRKPEPLWKVSDAISMSPECSLPSARPPNMTLPRESPFPPPSTHHASSVCPWVLYLSTSDILHRCLGLAYLSVWHMLLSACHRGDLERS